MKRKTLLMILIILTISILFVNCSVLFGKKPPKTFSKGEPGWTDIMVSDKIEQDVLLKKVIEVLVREGYEPELISKETGYTRTKYRYFVSVSDGSAEENVDYYRTRFIAQVSSDSSKIAIKCETYWLDGESWVLGWDTKYLEDVKDAIKGVVGGY
jgi:hypothetical protein